ncbi:hypothetical protein GFS24_08335 [Chitinophaga sp. SYP-B3965]|uniref:hypothetical protein n=1 Tax=Chitinophaga sp. SYP-B3965 TaxID=2663120 RepID=UPI001299D0B7|nr:hypothetical protein [Chitinophaga sp. SYP-B3965]MRG45119.1 hypothetical protein [Chitinophaga sp. SYP-B3965]
MKLMISLLGILLLAGCQPKEKRLDTDFEGKIIYKMFDLETHGLDSAKAALFRKNAKMDSMISYFDEGSFFSLMEGNPTEYQYFNPHTNQLYFKARNNDSLQVTNAEKELPGQAPLLDVSHELNTDTILGYACNKLTLKLKDETRIYLYSPQFATNPEWYQHTKAFNHDVVYKQMKAYFLSMRCEYLTFSFTLRATGIFPGKVPAGTFPKVENLPQIRF